MRLEVDSLDAEGRGVARNAEGKVVFVEGALGGERVECEIVRSGRRFDLARLRTVLRPASARRLPRCPYFGTCGGCATQHVDVRTQMAAKQRWLEENLARIGKLQSATLLPIVHGEEWGYRRRARLSARFVAGKGGALVGFRERRSTYVADMRTCEVLPPHVAALIPGLRELVGQLSIRERLPQIEVAVGDAATVLVIRNLTALTDADSALLRKFADGSGVRLWLQPSGPESAYPFHPEAQDDLHYDLPEFGVRVAFRPTDFTQVNTGINRILVSRAVRLLAPRPGERIGDLFCGLGNFSLALATQRAQIIGMDASASLIERARQNAAANGLGIRFEIANLFEPDLVPYGPFDKLLLDPPREGAIEVVKSLPDAWPHRIVYVSCDPATLSRDAAVLVHAKGFRLEAAGVLNMFPHTAHVESIALFER